MDINKIQKLNKLATDLGKHKVVMNSKQAIKKAERVYGKEHNYMTRHKSGDSEKDMTEKINKKLRDQQNQIQKNQEKISEVISKVNELIKEFKELKEISKKKLRQQQRLNQSRSNNQQEKEKVQKKLVDKGSKKKDPNEPIDRNDISPSKVSIEKYFYYGNK